MKFDEWWGTYNGKVIYSVGGVSNTHHREECKAIAHGAWKQGFDEGKKHVSLIRGADTEVCKDDPTDSETDDDMHLDPERLKELIDLLSLPFPERLKAAGLDYEEVETTHGTFTLIKNKYLDGHIDK